MGWGWGGGGASAGLGRPAKVLVLGAGSAGCVVARECEKLQGVGSVTLVDRKDHLDVSVGAPRALVDPEFGARATPLLAEVFPAGSKVEIVQVRDIVAARAGGATVVRASDGAEAVLSGFDVVVVATGSKYGCRFVRNDAASSGGCADRAGLMAQYRAFAAHVARDGAGGVLIVGGGVSGVEMAGEVATDCPHVKVTLVHGGEHLTPFAPALGRVCLASLQKLGVDVVLGDRVDAEDALLDAPRDYVTRGGRTIPGVTAVVDCTGIKGYNTEFLPAAALDAQGRVRTAPTLLVPALAEPGRPVFCCGDCADRCEQKFIAAMASAQSVAKGIREFCRTGRVTAKANVTPMGNFAILSIGRKEGAANLPFATGWAFNCLGRWAKAKDMMVPWMLKDQMGISFTRDLKP